MKPTLTQVFALSLLVLAALLGLLFFVVFDSSRQTIIESSERLRVQVGHEVGERVTAYLAQAPNAVDQFQGALHRDVCDPQNPEAVERALLALLSSNREIGDLTFTYGEKTGFADDGEIQLAPTPRGQLSVVRVPAADGSERLWSRHVHQENGAFVAEHREIDPKRRLADNPQTREPVGALPDPTTHLTFITPASRDFYGELLPSELHWSQLDADLPEPQRRVEVSVQQALTDADGNFAGVLRVGLLRQQLDLAVALKVTPEGVDDPHRIFICDVQGRLIAPVQPAAHVQEWDDGLRLTADSAPPEVAAALGDLQLREMENGSAPKSGQVRHGGQDFLTTFLRLRDDTETREWVVGIVVPRAFYLGRLGALRDRMLAVSLGMIVLVVGGGGLTLRAIKRAQSQIAGESVKMNRFEFAPAPTESAFRDVSDVLESFEKGKTAMRAMGRYVPIDLVRRLYREKSEPVLGGEDAELTIMFTDIKNFTAFSEQLPPDRLAAALGLYLDVMARIIQQETRGTIDKYIGDAIMALWNVPEPVPDHPRLACQAALRCRDAVRVLSQSPDWCELPPFETRFGLHTETALVGHFGAHDRMNYTAIGDAVNLASRLESLNKQYGTSIIASERIVEKTRDAFDFRLLDLVAVKGKSQAVKIYELLGAKGAGASGETADAYERAFAAYLARDFTGAIAILEAQRTDPPSAVLLDRCRAFLDEPPPADWTGVHVSTSK
jgi:adenylate cyclase